MKAVILAGGFGTRISEESEYKPKPMIEIGGMPILWHIMKTYSHYGINEFIICAGYKQHVIKEWFADYFLHTSDITFDFTQGSKWGEGVKWVNRYDGGPHEASFLKLDCSKLKAIFGWKPHWNLDTAIEMVVEWNKCWIDGGDVRNCMDREISTFLSKEKV